MIRIAASVAVVAVLAGVYFLRSGDIRGKVNQEKTASVPIGMPILTPTQKVIIHVVHNNVSQYLSVSMDATGLVQFQEVDSSAVGK